MSRHRGRKKTQKRPNYKNVGEEDEEERGAEEGPDEEKEKAKGTEASSKASRTSGDTEGEWPRMNVTPSLTDPLSSRAPLQPWSCSRNWPPSYAETMSLQPHAVTLIQV